MINNLSALKKICCILFSASVLPGLESCTTTTLPASAGAGATVQSAPASCTYNREQMLALDRERFDQDADGGWRAVAQQPGCLREAADLIRDYHQAQTEKSFELYWHEGQVRAISGESARAIELFEMSYNLQSDPGGWNIYVDATIAFLRQDKTALLKAYLALANLPVPANAQLDENGNSIADSWPPNLGVVEDLLACFGQEYRTAYQNCRA